MNTVNKIVSSVTGILTPDKWVAVGKGAGLAGVGAVLTYLGQWSTGTDLGQAGPIVAAILAVLANVLRKYMTAETAPDMIDQLLDEGKTIKAQKVEGQVRVTVEGGEQE